MANQMTAGPNDSAEASPEQNVISDVVGFWDRRHRNESLLRSGGHISRTESENLAFYYKRLGLIIDALGGMGGESARARLLDAGCGKGLFAEWLAGCGFAVTAIDSSETAVAEAQTRSAGEVEYQMASLDRYTSWPPFEAVISIDVLFHIVEEQTWEASVENLAGLVSPGGLFVVSDAGTADFSQSSDYIRYHDRQAYEAILGDRGFRHRRSLPYGDKASPISLHVFQRG